MRYVDRIIILESGRIVDQGSLDDLAQRCGVFQNILRAHAKVSL